MMTRVLMDLHQPGPSRGDGRGVGGVERSAGAAGLILSGSGGGPETGREGQGEKPAYE